MDTQTQLAQDDRPLRSRVRNERMLLLAILVFVVEALLTASLLTGAA